MLTQERLAKGHNDQPLRLLLGLQHNLGCHSQHPSCWLSGESKCDSRGTVGLSPGAPDAATIMGILTTYTTAGSEGPHPSCAH